MKVFVNAVSVKEGGPRVVLVKLLEAMCLERRGVAMCVAAPPSICEEVPRSVLERHPVAIGQSPFALMKWYEVDLATAARKWRADVVFSVTNYLPRRRLPIPTLLLEQHAGHFSPAFDQLTLAYTPSFFARFAWRYKRRWVHRSVEAATVLTVQTAALADAIAAIASVQREQIQVVPHGPGWVEKNDRPRVGREGTDLRIGYITKWGVQKNFTTLFRAVKRLSERRENVRLVLTLDPAHASTAETLAEAEAIGISRFIENHGEVATHAIEDLYGSLDIFVFPSLCESFGMPMVEAMARGLCIVAADTSTNREIVGSAGIFFSAFDSEQLATILQGLSEDDAARQSRSVLSLKRARDFSWQKAAHGTLAALDMAVASKDG